MRTLNDLSTFSWLHFLFGSKKCSQIVAIGEYFWRICLLSTYSDEWYGHKRKVSQLIEVTILT